MPESAPSIKAETPAIELNPLEIFEQAMRELGMALDAHMEAMKAGNEEAKREALRQVGEASRKVNSAAGAAGL